MRYTKAVKVFTTQNVSVWAVCLEYRMLLQSLSKENDIGGASVDSDA